MFVLAIKRAMIAAATRLQMKFPIIFAAIPLRSSLTPCCSMPAAQVLPNNAMYQMAPITQYAAAAPMIGIQFIPAVVSLARTQSKKKSGDSRQKQDLAASRL